MKNTTSREVYITIIAILSFFLAIYMTGTKMYERGFKKGVITALDSVNNIVNRQLTDKTISSKFLIQSSDTLEFILSPKTIKMK